MNSNHFEKGFELVALSLQFKRSVEDIHDTLKSRGYSEKDIYFCIQAGQILFRDYSNECLAKEKSSSS